ncbi:PP2C family protein-serine/threonine phosphatase [Glutamicibacter endophyticus]|uniref:PP2C family protein-serine/threonine phosphatase n=1 Tax=Glutamicibacter endophyticus TaxID=1522174 RepID=UPI003AF02347
MSGPSTRFQLAAAGRTHVGLRRTENQDRYLVTEHIQAVADGMGGHEAGEVAAQLAVETLEELQVLVYKTSEPAVLTQQQVVRQVQLADDRIRDALEARGGTTLCMLCMIGAEEPSEETQPVPSAVPPWTGSYQRGPNTDVVRRITPQALEEYRRQAADNLRGQDNPKAKGRALLLVNVGDSRGYRLRNGQLVQLTRDHSAVQEMVDAGQITEAEARNHPHRNLITRALGAGADSHPDTTVLRPRVGDRYLLCSDGLSGELSVESIAELLISYRNRDAAAAALVSAAVEAGGRDNVAVVVVDVLAE